MPTLTLPHTLTAGQPENVNELTANLVAIRDAINGTLDATNFATSAKPATLLGQWRTVSEARATADVTDAAGLNYMVGDGIVQNGTGSAFSPATVDVDPTDWTVAGLTTRLRIRAVVVANGVNPGTLITFGLHPFTIAGSGNFFVTLAAAVASSTVALGPVASDELRGVSAEFAVPAAGVYAFGVSLTSTVDANSVVGLHSILQVRHI